MSRKKKQKQVREQGSKGRVAGRQVRGQRSTPAWLMPLLVFCVALIAFVLAVVAAQSK